MTDYPFEAETRLIRWADSSTAGRTITIELPPDDGAAHPFRGFPVGHQHGQRFRMRFEPIADDETPARDPATVPESRPAPETGPPTPAPNSPGPGAHPNLVRSMAGKQRYAEADDMERAVMRAGALAVDHEFQAWASRYGGPLASVDAAAQFIRRRCAIDSRKEIGVNERAYQAFRSLETEFDLARKRLPEPRG